MNSIDNKKDYRQGLISVLGSSIWWGIMPIYWQWLKPIDSIVIIFYRIVLVALVCLIAALIAHKKGDTGATEGQKTHGQADNSRSHNNP